MKARNKTVVADWVRPAMWILTALLILRGFEAVFRAPAYGLMLAVALVWAGILAAPLTGDLLKRANVPVGGWLRFAAAAAPIMTVAFLIATRSVPEDVSRAADPASPNAEVEDRVSYPHLVQKIVGQHLIDPASARYSDVVAYRTDKILTFCGSVNSRNRLGGYAGPVAFVVSDSGIFIGPDATLEVVQKHCRGASAIPVEF